MGDPLWVREATLDEAPAVYELMQDAVRWLGRNGHEQWQTPSFGLPDRIREAIAAGETWTIYDGTTLVASAILNAYADPEFWTVEDKPESAFYLHRVVVRRASAGLGVGSSVLDWAGKRTFAAGRELLRLDAWATNTELQSYYLSQGFRLVRTLRLAHRGSGALFERPASLRMGRGPVLRPATTAIR